MTWVGRSLPRSEDRALVSGDGWFTADAAAGARAVVFVRSPVARGRILGIERPEGATVITAADLAGVAGIRPLLHRPDYVPVEQPILAGTHVTFAGQPVAAVIAASREEAEDIAEQVFVDIEPEDAVVDVDAALAPGAPLVHSHAAGNVLVEGKVETKGFAEARRRCRGGRRDRRPLPPAERHAARGARRPRCLRPAHRPRHAHLLDPDASHAPHRHRRLPRHARARAPRRRARCRRRLRPEDGADPGIYLPRLGRTPLRRRARLGRGPAREPYRVLP